MKWKRGDMNYKDYLFNNLNSYLILFNGFFCKKLSHISNLLDISENFDSVFVKIKKNIKKPIQILNILEKDDVVFPKIVVLLEENSQAEILFNMINLKKEKIWVNQNIEFYLKKGAILKKNYFFSKCCNLSIFHFFNAFLEEDSTFDIKIFPFNLDPYGSIDMQYLDFKISLNKKNSKFFLNGLNLLREKNRSFFDLKVTHENEKTVSQQKFKVILKKKSISNFKSEVYITKKAKNSFCSLLNKNFILEEKAKVLSSPFLVISSDEVEAYHGSNLFNLKEEDLFYLKTRGIGCKEAKYLFIKSFCKEIIKMVNVSSLKQQLKQYVKNIFLKDGCKKRFSNF
ncbi:MAG: hypothetical protein AMS24_00165 [Chlamydiae bacterium SM23_39]|nr:MAG: hypothetical protein AMS24_00165 [Chlamydiae bacterium SM23_39]